jgi:hypothetical protein
MTFPPALLKNISTSIYKIYEVEKYDYIVFICVGGIFKGTGRVVNYFFMFYFQE